jgi:hypothetical protein
MYLILEYTVISLVGKHFVILLSEKKTSFQTFTIIHNYVPLKSSKWGQELLI